MISMTGTNCGQMQPLYEAMAVSSSVIKMLEQQEKHQQKRQADFELQGCLADLVKHTGEFLELVSSNPLRDVSPETLNGLIWCVDRLNSMTQLVIRKTREVIPTISEDLRPTMELLLNQIEALTVRVEDVLEAWLLGSSSDWSKFLDDAVTKIGNRRSDIPEDWRKSLELIPD
jgi:hypothetical protein